MLHSKPIKITRYETRQELLDKEFPIMKAIDYDDNNIMHFGKHQGKRLGDVPSQYLLWWWDKADGWAKTERDKQEDWSLHRYVKTALNDLVKKTGYILEHKPKIH